MTFTSNEELLRVLEGTQSVADIPLRLAKEMNASHCVLWKPSKRLGPMWGKSLELEPANCKLYPLTSTFSQKEAGASGSSGLAHSGLPLDFKNDFTGRVYRQAWEEGTLSLPRELRRHADFASLDRDCVSYEFMNDRGLKKIAVSLFHLEKGDVSGHAGAPYAVSLYRTGEQSDFTDFDVARLDELVRLIPFLVDRHTNENLHAILVDVQRALVPPRSDKPSPPNTDIRRTLDELCKKMAGTFHCEEVTIILRDPQERKSSDPVFSVCGSSLPQQYIQSLTFVPNKSDGLTGYILVSGKTLEFHDLRNFLDEKMSEVIQKRYPGISWNDSATILGYFNEMSKKHTQGIGHAYMNRVPVAFLGIPIFSPRRELEEATQLIGVVRCSLGTNPFFFLPAEKKVLGLIASGIGHWWADQLMVNAESTRANLFKGLIKTHDAIQNFIQSAIVKDQMLKLDDSILETVLNALVNDFGGLFSMICYRRRRAETNLYQPVQHKGSSTRLIADLQLDKTLLGTAGSKDGHHWIARSDILSRANQWEYQYCLGSEGVLSIPVAGREDLIGILELGCRICVQGHQHEDEIVQVSDSIAKQIGLYEKVRANQAELQRYVDNQIRMFHSVGHQIKSPLANASEVLDTVLFGVSEARRSSEAALSLGRRLSVIAPRQLPRLAGMVRKAQSVGRFMEWFGKLSKDQPLELKFSSVAVFDLWRWVDEIYQNNLTSEETSEIDSSGREQLRFLGVFKEFSESKFRSADAKGPSILCNRIATEQVLDAVIGNAIKYGRDQTPVEVSGSEVGNDFVVLIKNVAAPDLDMSEEEAKRCFEEGYRSPKTERKMGSGLGLWIAKKLMEAQTGRIEAHATTELGVTSFSLFFPIRGRDR